MPRTNPPHALPSGQHLIPYLAVKGARAALAFYRDAFGATELYRLEDASGAVAHAEVLIGKGHFMLADEHPGEGHLAPSTLGGCSAALLLYVEDVDAVVARAVAAGAELVRPPADQFYGDRGALVRDPFGHRWMVASRIEDVGTEEILRRYAAMG